MDKSQLTWLGGASVAAVLIFGMTFLNWFKTNLTYHRRAAGIGWNIAGVGLWLIGVVGMWYTTYEQFDSVWPFSLAIGGVFFSTMFACGFDFGDIHLPPEKR